jgi:hypothetical protein
VERRGGGTGGGVAGDAWRGGGRHPNWDWTVGVETLGENRIGRLGEGAEGMRSVGWDRGRAQRRRPEDGARGADSREWKKVGTSFCLYFVLFSSRDLRIGPRSGTAHCLLALSKGAALACIACTGSKCTCQTEYLQYGTGLLNFKRM